MRAQAIDSLAAWPVEIIPSHGTLVLSGYGLSVRVWRGQLRVSDGCGRDRREALVHRATGRLRRLVVLGHTGSLSLEAIRWLADVGAGYLQIDADGRVLAAFGPLRTDRPSLRRAQASALDTPAGNDIVRRLLAQKVAGQAQTLAAFAEVGSVTDETVEALRVAAARLHVGISRDDLRLAEAQAAAAYWSAWSSVPVRFASRDADRVPAHWQTFGSRTSPLTGSPRLAGNPANAILNYLYALLEGEASIAARVVGLDPGLGLLHADQLNRDSLAADLMEPVRPQVDRYVLRLLASRSFAAADFFETRRGVCRVTPPVGHELARTVPHWGQLVGTVAEDVSALLEGKGTGRGAVPTPISGRNRSAGRLSLSRRSAPTRGRLVPVAARACSVCGGPTSGVRRTCGEACEVEAREATDGSSFLAAGVAKLAALRLAGDDPAHSPTARAKVGATQSRRRLDEEGWDAAHPGHADPALYREQILPALAQASVSRIARATGLSLAYCARIKRGEAVPHARWWEALVELGTEA